MSGVKVEIEIFQAEESASGSPLQNERLNCGLEMRAARDFGVLFPSASSPTSFCFPVCTLGLMEILFR